ncbi:tyrosine-type recombinase/integrase [Chitinophaga agri]|uniref:Tyrosine-type recombinase/integrase n=1 Tax=Chitinophaga agri TaxID=2703787 RepID=A0A6B9Z7R5_9BACT|nr:tyrosine-type recombinase/integrase [Chitinophaga agri]QHS58037.1 tyrosine-type recombinase/integrase [Chitinophaga agri]
MERYVMQFRDYLQQSGYSIGTQRMLPACVRDFLEHGSFKSLQEITPLIIGIFYEWLHIRPSKRKGGGALSGMMIRHYVYALRVFFRWQEHSGRLSYNPMSGLRLGKSERISREALNEGVVQELFSAAGSYRERVMLHLFYSCGLRRSEAEQLNVRDVQVRHRLLYVRSGKGASRRVIR